MWKSICYSPLYLILWLHALLPLRVLYLLADLLYYPLYHLVGYRRKVVRRNLTQAFPQLTPHERLKIERGFYHHLCNTVVESIKLLHISDKEMRRRMVFEGVEELERFTREGRSCIVLLGHYGNWEWITSITLWVAEGSIDFAQIYRPLKSAWFDTFMLKLRSRFHSRCIPKQDTLRAMLSARRQPTPMVTGFIADQSPSPANIHYWSEFLGQPTPMLTGAEKIATKLDLPLLYFDVECTQRGYYRITVRLVEEHPKSAPPCHITERYTRLMEQTILRAPAYWLWSHNRWKHAHLYGKE